MAMTKLVNIEIAYGTKIKQVIIPLAIACGSTIAEAIQVSGILRQFPEIDLRQNEVGIFSRKRHLSDPVSHGDRIEIYRPLTLDPKEARRIKAKARA